MRQTLIAAALVALATPAPASVISFDGALLQFQQVNTLAGDGPAIGFGPVFFTAGPGVDVVDDSFTPVAIASDFDGDTLTISNQGVLFDVGSQLQPFVLSFFYTDLFNQLPDIGAATLVDNGGISSGSTPITQALTDALTVSPDVIAFRFDGLSFLRDGFVTYRFDPPPEPPASQVPPTPTPTPIPLPAAAPLMAAGLGMLALLRRRRS